MVLIGETRDARPSHGPGSERLTAYRTARTIRAHVVHCMSTNLCAIPISWRAALTVWVANTGSDSGSKLQAGDSKGSGHSLPSQGHRRLGELATYLANLVMPSEIPLTWTTTPGVVFPYCVYGPSLERQFCFNQGP
jgi:hypothetical protein